MNNFKPELSGPTFKSGNPAKLHIQAPVIGGATCNKVYCLIHNGTTGRGQPGIDGEVANEA